ncbi:hypothetical protein FGO68_gene15436 [Halteria grandinella]|uniref:Uncharacterized protein n=1 Tax=Halteria grandinella TaxID=5974 RepID=A0A8J8P5U2_HALGN|nr:hypothetical protein FGO68_gene15436 [Halteria grandinella]
MLHKKQIKMTSKQGQGGQRSIEGEEQILTEEREKLELALQKMQSRRAVPTANTPDLKDVQRVFYELHGANDSHDAEFLSLLFPTGGSIETQVMAPPLSPKSHLEYMQRRSKWTLFIDLLSQDPKNLKVQQYIRQRIDNIKKRQQELQALQQLQANNTSNKKKLAHQETFEMGSPMKSFIGNGDFSPSKSIGTSSNKKRRSVMFETEAEKNTFSLLATAMQGTNNNQDLQPILNQRKVSGPPAENRFKAKDSFYQLTQPTQIPKTEEEKRRAQLLDELVSQFRKEDARYRGLRQDLKSLEQNLKASKRFLSQYKKSTISRPQTSQNTQDYFSTPILDIQQSSRANKHFMSGGYILQENLISNPQLIPNRPSTQQNSRILHKRVLSQTPAIISYQKPLKMGAQCYHTEIQPRQNPLRNFYGHISSNSQQRKVLFNGMNKITVRRDIPREDNAALKVHVDKLRKWQYQLTAPQSQQQSVAIGGWEQSQQVL